MMSNLALLWVAIEVTTVISALLVAIEDTDGAAEAAWKYVLLASAGLGLALLATIFAYYVGRARAWPVLRSGVHRAAGGSTAAAARSGAAHVRAGRARLRHQDGPVPGAYLAAGCAFRGADTGVRAAVRARCWPSASTRSSASIRWLRRRSDPRSRANVLLVFGVASLLLAALYLFGQRDIKRLLAYSSVEHMGILAIGVSFGAPAALAGVLLHVLAHAAAKGNAFMGAGVLVRKFGTKRISAIRGGLDLLPWSGPLFLLAIFALGAMPPFGLFRSEFEIVAGGFASAATGHRGHPHHRRDGGVLRPRRSTVTQILLVPRTRRSGRPPCPQPAPATVGRAAARRGTGSAARRKPARAAPGAAAGVAAVRGASRAPGWSCPSLAGALVLLSSACIRRPI